MVMGCLFIVIDVSLIWIWVGVRNFLFDVCVIMFLIWFLEGIMIMFLVVIWFFRVNWMGLWINFLLFRVLIFDLAIIVSIIWVLRNWLVVVFDSLIFEGVIGCLVGVGEVEDVGGVIIGFGFSVILFVFFWLGVGSGFFCFGVWVFVFIFGVFIFFELLVVELVW